MPDYGKQHQFLARRVTITSNHHWSRWWKNRDDIAAFQARVDKSTTVVMEFKVPFVQSSLSPPLATAVTYPSLALSFTPSVRDAESVLMDEDYSRIDLL